MKIAISLLTHNDLLYLKPCIESLLTSDIVLHTIKLFVHDNASNNNLKKYLKNIRIEKYIHFSDTNHGIVIPRIQIFNEIIKEDFDYLLEIHSDMLFPKIWLTPLLQIDDERTGILEPHIYLPRKKITVDELEHKLRELRHKKTFDNCRQVHPWLIKLKFVECIGGYYDIKFSPQQCEDDDFIYRCITNGYKVKSTSLSWVCHYGGVTRSKALPSYSKAHKKYFMEKHKIDFESFLNMFDFHPFEYEPKISILSKLTNLIKSGRKTMKPQ